MLTNLRALRATCASTIATFSGDNFRVNDEPCATRRKKARCRKKMSDSRDVKISYMSSPKAANRCRLTGIRSAIRWTHAIDLLSGLMSRGHFHGCTGPSADSADMLTASVASISPTRGTPDTKSQHVHDACSTTEIRFGTCVSFGR